MEAALNVSAIDSQCRVLSDGPQFERRGPYTSNMRVFDTSFDYKTDKPAKTKPDADKDSPRLRLDHALLWTKKLNSGVLFAPTPPSRRRDGYLIFTDGDENRHWYGSDAITSSYTTWTKPKALVNAVAKLSEDEKSRYLDPPYIIGSSMIWPVRSKDRATMNRERGFRLSIADRMDLTVECIRCHYAGEPEGPLTDAINAYADFFALFDGGFKEFVDFFHLQDLVTHDYKQVQFYLPFNGFDRAGTPATKDEYVMYREATLEFVVRRNRRMAQWVMENHPEIEVRG